MSEPRSGSENVPAEAREGPTGMFLLAALGRRIRTDLDAELDSVGMSLRYLSALGHLSRQPGTSGSELARRAGVTSQSMQATLLHLEQCGAIVRADGRERGRRASYQVTPEGNSMLDRAHTTIASADRRLADLLGPEDHGELTRILWRLAGTSVRPAPER